MTRRLTAILLLIGSCASARNICRPESDTLSGRAENNIATAIEEVVVTTGARHETDVRHLPMTVSVVDRGRIERDFNQSLLPTLSEQIPGLFATGRSIMGYGVSGGAAGQISLRGIGGAPQAGLPTTGLLVLIDGHPQYMGLMGHPIADAYQATMAERVEVLRGPASVLYGSNAMGGVINIVTRRMRENAVRTHLNVGYGSYNTLQTEAANTIRRSRFNSTVTASYNRSDGHRARMGFEQYGGYAKLGYDISGRWNVTADANLTHFNASNPGQTTSPLLDNDQRITRGMASLALKNDYGPTSGAISLFYNWGHHDIDDGHSPDSAPLDYRFRSRDDMAGVSVYQSMRLFAGNRITVGMDYFRFGGEAENDYHDGNTSTLADKTLHEIAAYADVRQHLRPWLTLDAGLRIDHHSHTGTEWVPQAGLAFHLPHGIETKAMASKGFRYPTIREMYMFPPQNPDLAPERLWNYEISFTQRLCEGRMEYGLNLFHIAGDNLIMRLPVGGSQLNVNSGRISNTGIEAQAACRISRSWSVDANYSFLHMENPVLASPQHKLYAGARFARGRWDISTGVQYVAGLYTSVAVNGVGICEQEDFVLWNLRGSFRISDNFRLFARGENLLAQRYEINAGYPMPRATFLGGVDINF